MIRRLSNGGAAQARNNLATEPDSGNMIPENELGRIPPLSENPNGVRSPGTLVKVREDELARLVYAARETVFSVTGERNWPDCYRDLDKASEAFADQFPWNDEPTDETRPLRPGERIDLGKGEGGRASALVCLDGEVLVETSTKLGVTSVLLNPAQIRALATVGRRIP
jgi:hypothetical protein